MPIRIRGKQDDELKQFSDALAPYAKEHSLARIEIYRRNDAIVCVRIIDPGFRGTGLAEREVPIWKLLEPLPEDVLNQLYLLILVTPQEAKKSMASYEFDHPVTTVE